MLKTKKLFIYLSALLATAMLLVGCESTIQDPIVPASENPPLNGESPEVIVESLRGNEYVKGGVLYQIHMIITDPTLDTNSSTVEYSRDGGSTWVIATSSTGQNGSEFPTYSGEETVFNWSVPRETNCLAGSASSDGNNYKIRVTSRGRPDAFPTTWTSPGTFTVDSCAPVVSGINFAYSSTSNTGFSLIDLPNISDTFALSPIKDICLKYIVTTVPTETDSCWLNVNSLTGTANQTSVSGVSIPFFFGYSAITSMTATLWARDYAHNQTELTLVASMPTGVTGTDITDTFARSCGGSNCTSSTVTGGVVSSNVVVNIGSTVTHKTDSPDVDKSLLDPQMFVVNSAGIVYLRDKVRGIVKINPVTSTQTVIIPLSGSIADGLLATATVRKPMRIALDREENLIIFDYDRIRRVNLNVAPGSQTIETIVGGGTDTSGTVKTATALQISYHDNLMYYGTFQVLPNNWIVFNSESPVKQLNNSILANESDRFRLRVYRPDRDTKIVSIKLSGTGVDIDPAQSVNELWPYGGMAVTYDSTNKDIGYIYARLCDADVTCSQQSLGAFNEDGEAITSTVTVPGSFSNNTMFVSKSGNLYSMNRYEGYVKRHNGSVWQTILGRGMNAYPGSLCADGTTRTSCDINLWDVFIGLSERTYFIDNGRIRFVDLLNGRVYTYVTLAP